MSTETSAATATWKIDPTHTLVELSARHMMITTVKGRFTGVSGVIELNEEDPTGSTVRVELESASIDTGVQQRDDHLRSADFLDVESFPTITFQSREVRRASVVPGEAFELVGELTIRGVTKEVVIQGTYDGKGRDPWGGDRVSFSGSTRIDRRDFGLTWNQALETGGILVGNEVKISLEVQAVKG